MQHHERKKLSGYFDRFLNPFSSLGKWRRVNFVFGLFNFLKTFSFSFNESIIHEVLIFFARSWSSPNLKTFVLKIFRFDKDQKQPPEVFCKRVFLEISQNSQPQPCNFIKKETLARVFSGEFCEISMNLFLQSTSGGCF